jgi:hypothetical protein
MAFSIPHFMAKAIFEFAYIQVHYLKIVAIELKS